MRALPSRYFLRSGVALFLFAILTAPAGSVFAQSNGDGSIYSRYGIGTLKTFSSSQSQALGGGGYALRSLNYNPMGNPALWSDQVFTRLAAGGSYERIHASGTRDQTSRLSSGSVEAVHFNFPLYERKLGVGLSFQPYSVSNHQVVRNGEVSLGPSDTTSTPYEVHFQGAGGLHSLRGGLGYEINEAVRVGASVDVIFGIVENQRRTEFGRSTTPIRNTVVSDATRLSGVTGTVGTHLSFVDVLSEDDALSLGGAFVLPTSLDGRRVRTLDEDLARDTLSSVQGSTSLPWRTRLGAAYQPNERWSFVVDGVFEPWSSFSSSFDDPSFGQQFPVGGDETLTDRWRISAGAEVVPGGDNALTGFFGRTGYRMGGYAEQLYVQPDGQTNVNVYAVTGGVSLPTSLPGTRLDLNVEAGVRGHQQPSFVRDVFYGVSLHVNFGERWFQKRKLR